MVSVAAAARETYQCERERERRRGRAGGARTASLAFHALGRDGLESVSLLTCSSPPRRLDALP
eukprot:1694746-Rhodomonas_salina.1